ncbi:MAG: cytidine deaminase [Bacteroidetes bacterium]|nr:cytidine deaminase [Bacteroidota bacterium]
MATKLEFKTELTVFENVSDLGKQEYDLLQEARKATGRAYAPYSNFNVGAAILLDDDTIVTGTNQENAAYPSGLCAERVAIFAAGANYPDKVIKMVAVAAKKHPSPRGKSESAQFLPAAPCGACRQVMLEYEIKQGTSIKIIIGGEKGKIYISESVKMLLPFHFTL